MGQGGGEFVWRNENERGISRRRCRVSKLPENKQRITCRYWRNLDWHDAYFVLNSSVGWEVWPRLQTSLTRKCPGQNSQIRESGLGVIGSETYLSGPEACHGQVMQTFSKSHVSIGAGILPRIALSGTWHLWIGDPAHNMPHRYSTSFARIDWHILTCPTELMFKSLL
jgi:hypothetical protein